MALISCPQCGNQISDQAPACPHCGYQAGQTYDEQPQAEQYETYDEPQPQGGGNRKLQWVVVAMCVVLLAIVAALLWINVFNNAEKKVQEAAYAYVQSKDADKAAGLTPEAIKVVEQGEDSGIYKASFPSGAVLVEKRDGEWTVYDTFGFESFPDDQLAFARKVGDVNDDMSDGKIGEVLNSSSFAAKWAEEGKRIAAEELLKKKRKAYDAYAAVLLQYRNTEGYKSEQEMNSFIGADYSNYTYFLYDVTNDGIPELWVHSGSCEADYRMDAYTCNGETSYASHIYSGDAGHTGFHLGSSYVLASGGQMDYYWSNKLVYDASSGKIVETNHIERSVRETGYPEIKEPQAQDTPIKNLNTLRSTLGVTN